jgi:cell fate regulator YaaT (PSP1 superfamily)
MLMKIAGVRFRDKWKVYDFDASDVELAVGDSVVVDTEKGQGFGKVVRLREGPPDSLLSPPPPPQRPAKSAEKAAAEEEVEIEIDIDDIGAEPAPAPVEQAPRQVRRVLRKAADDDLLREQKNRDREREAFAVCAEVIAERELPMRLVRAEYSFDGGRVTFYFFAENRVDFRELVKELAHKLRARIEMRQIGVRDVARLIGGFGPCGRELCCASFLKTFEPVSIRMAKKQEVVLNPAKISGVCGRLLCCLSYEYGMYDAIKKDVAELRETEVREKREAEERRQAEERREAEDRRRDEERRRQEQQRRDRQQREQPQPKGGRSDKSREQAEAKKQPQPDQQRERQRDQQKPEQKAAQQPGGEGQQTAGKAGKKRGRRRFWRKKKKPGE